MSASGGDAQRISFGDGRYSTPVWSPKGDYIAFTKQGASTFAIGIMKPDGSGERILTEGFHNEGPTWAPNGLFLMFFRDPGGDSGAAYFHDRRVRPGRIPGPDAVLRLRSGLGPAAVVVAASFPAKRSGEPAPRKSAAQAPPRSSPKIASPIRDVETDFEASPLMSAVR